MYPIIDLVAIESLIKLMHRQFSVQLEGLMDNSNRLVNNGLSLRIWLGLLLMGDELLEHTHHIMHYFSLKHLLLLGMLLLSNEALAIGVATLHFLAKAWTRLESW